jgi:hypothetical protein
MRVKKAVVVVGIVAAVAVMASAAFAAGSLKTFEENATVTLGKHNSAHIVVAEGGNGGVYRSAGPSKPLKKANFSFVSTGDVQGGAPRWSIAVTTDEDRSTVEGYAFLDAAGCGAANGHNPLGIATTVSTKKDNCHVNFLGVDYANWKALVAAFPTARTADAASFVISDVAGDYNVSRVHFG